jgi:hypothetical protein
MKRALYFLFAVSFAGGCTPTRNPTQADLVGQWRVDPTFVPNHRYTRPPEFYLCRLNLNADGTFVALDVPADFFFPHTPATSERKGTWTTALELDNFYHINLTFRPDSSGKGGFYGTLIDWKGDGKYTQRVISMSHRKEPFYMTKTF